MKVMLVFVPPGGGEADYTLSFDLPGVPQPGDYISIRRGDEAQTEDFIVRRTLWHLETPETRTHHDSDDVQYGEARDIAVECEFAVGPFSSDSHKSACKRYDAKAFEATAH